MIILAFLLAVYIAYGIVITKLHKQMYGRGSVLAWIPYCNLYLLGKLTINKFAGWAVALLAVLSTALSSNLALELTGNSMMLAKVRASVSELSGTLSLLFLVNAIFKYLRLKQNRTESDEKIASVALQK